MVTWVAQAAEAEKRKANDLPVWARRRKSADLLASAFAEAVEIIGNKMAELQERHQLGRNCHHFRHLSDRTLSDIGVSRADVHCRTYGPCRQVPNVAKPHSLSKIDFAFDSGVL